MSIILKFMPHEVMRNIFDYDWSTSARKFAIFPKAIVIKTATLYHFNRKHSNCAFLVHFLRNFIQALNINLYCNNQFISYNQYKNGCGFNFGFCQELFFFQLVINFIIWLIIYIVNILCVQRPHWPVKLYSQIDNAILNQYIDVFIFKKKFEL